MKSIEDDVFVGEVYPIASDQDDATEAEFYVRAIPDGDMELLRPGAVFYVNIRTVRDRRGAPSTTSTIRFRRLGKWSREELDDFLARSRAQHQADADLFD